MEQDRVNDLHDSNSDKDDGEPSKDVNDTAPLLEDDTNNLTLGKKKSWFGSLREMGSKLGLRTKPTVGRPPRGETHRPENEAPTVTPPRHRRNVSIANSLRGSLRSLSHMKRKGPDSPASQRRSMSVDMPAEQVPLPSSPINISATAPMLSLDVSSHGLMSTAFIRNTLSDPANITTGTPVRERRLHIPPEMEARFAQESAERLNSESSGGSDKRSKIFERSVTPPNDPERRTLRNMRSLNALADTCTTEQSAAKDGTRDELEATHTDLRTAQHEPLTPFETLLSEMDSPDRDFFSDTTIEVLPSDMPKLTRQDAREPTTPCHGRQIVLPFRPKHNVEQLANMVQTAVEKMIDIDETSQSNATPRNSDNLSPNPLDRIPSRDSSTSVSTRSPSTVDLGDANHRFSFDNWLKISSTSPASHDELRPSPRRETSGSTDSLSVEEAITTPEAHLVEFSSELQSSMSVGPLELRDMIETDHTSPMGSKIEFHLKRSERNARYNAIHQIFSVRHHRFEDIDANQLADVDVDKAYASSPLAREHAGGEQEKPSREQSLPDHSSREESIRLGSPPTEADDLSDDSSMTYIASAAEADLTSVREELAAAITVLESTGTISKSESSESTPSLVDMVIRKKKSEESKTALSSFKPREPWQEPVDTVLFSSGLVHPNCCTQQHGEDNRSAATAGRQGTGSMPSPVKDRVASAADTLDRILDRFESPVRLDGGDRGEKYTISPPWNTVPVSPKKGKKYEDEDKENRNDEDNDGEEDNISAP